MKSSHLYLSALAAASLAVTANVQGQSQPSQPGNLPSPASSMSSGTSGLSNISRVSKDAVANRLTAKDLIGAAVYDTSGDKIGDIADVDLQGSFPSSLAIAFDARRLGSADRDTNRAIGSNADRPLSSANRPASSTPSTQAQATRQSTQPQSAQSQSSQSRNDGGHGTVFISVGGLWGMGEDLVSVPASQLSYNAAEERFQLAVSKAEVAAIAEQKAGDYAARPGARSTTTAGKQSFAEEASRLQSSLRADPMTSAFASQITVRSDGDKLELHGTVENREQKKKLVDAARRASSHDIEDKLEVR